MSNSFMIKGWCVTLVAALFALAAKDSEVKFAVIAYFIIPIFWILDVFFLLQKRRLEKCMTKYVLKMKMKLILT